MTRNTARAILGGLAGTIAFTFVLYAVVPLLIGHPMDVAGLLAGLLHTSATVGMVVHLLLGVIVFPLLYVSLFRPFLPGTPAGRGFIFGVSLWIVAEAIVVPAGGAGFFHIGHGGLAAMFGSLLAHLCYGGLLGRTAGEWEPPAEVVGTSRPGQVPETRSDAAPVDRRAPVPGKGERKRERREHEEAGTPRGRGR